MRIMAIDPGSTRSAYVVIAGEGFTPVAFDKVSNEELFTHMALLRDSMQPDAVVVERVAAYGMRVGQEVFDTAAWQGRYSQCAVSLDIPAFEVFRRDVKLHICGRASAKDADIIQALKDRFGGKGTKANPGFFYGFKADCWQAFALGLAYLETNNDRKRG